MGESYLGFMSDVKEELEVRRGSDVSRNCPTANALVGGNWDMPRWLQRPKATACYCVYSFVISILRIEALDRIGKVVNCLRWFEKKRFSDYL